MNNIKPPKYDPRPMKYDHKPIKYSHKPSSCKDPNHYPVRLLVHIPAGETYTHVCPSCGHQTTIVGDANV